MNPPSQPMNRLRNCSMLLVTLFAALIDPKILAGEHDIHVWHEGLGQLRARVTVLSIGELPSHSDFVKTEPTTVSI